MCTRFSIGAKLVHSHVRNCNLIQNPLSVMARPVNQKNARVKAVVPTVKESVASDSSATPVQKKHLRERLSRRMRVGKKKKKTTGVKKEVRVTKKKKKRRFRKKPLCGRRMGKNRRRGRKIGGGRRKLGRRRPRRGPHTTGSSSKKQSRTLLKYGRRNSVPRQTPDSTSSITPGNPFALKFGP